MRESWDEISVREEGDRGKGAGQKIREGGHGEGGRIVRAEWCWEQDDGGEGRLIGPWRGWVGSTAIRKRRRRPVAAAAAA